MTGTVTEMKSVSPFVADRDIMLYNRAGADEASKILGGLSRIVSKDSLLEFKFNLNYSKIVKVHISKLQFSNLQVIQVG